MAYQAGLPFDPTTMPAFNVSSRPQERSPLAAAGKIAGGWLTSTLPLAVEKGLGTLTPEREQAYMADMQRRAVEADRLLPGGPMNISQVRGVGDVGTLVKENLLYSLPQMGASIGGALVAKRLGVNPFVGATAASTPTFVATNIERATESGTKRLTGDQLMRSVAVAPAQALADTAAERFLPFARGIFGKGAATQSGGFVSRTAKSMGKAAAVEGVTETGQQAAERYAAGLVLTDHDAAREYVQSFGTAFFVGGAMGSFGGFRKPPTNVSSPNAPTEELQSVVDQELGLAPPPAADPVQMDLDLGPSAAAFPVGYQPDLFGNSYEDLEQARRPLKGVATEELTKALGAQNPDPAALAAVQQELAIRNSVNNSVSETSASSAVEAVEPTLLGGSGGAAQGLQAPASIPDILKGISTRKSYSDAVSIEDVGAILRARLEAGSTAKGDFLLAERLGIDTNAPAAAPVEAETTRVPIEALQQAPLVGDLPESGLAPANQGVDGRIYVGDQNTTHFHVTEKFPKVDFTGSTGFVTPDGRYLNREEALAYVNADGVRVKPSNTPGELDALDYKEQRNRTPEPAAPANQGGGDLSVDPEFEAWWKGRKRGKDKAVRALNPTNYADLDDQLFRELGEPRNTETLFSKSDHLEQLAAERGILDDQGNLTEKGMDMAVAQGIVPPTINEAQSQEIMKRRMVASANSGIVSETQWQQQDANEVIDKAGLQPVKQESDLAALKRMVRDGDIEGAMMGLQRVQRGESLFVQPERGPIPEYKGERASGLVNRDRIRSARLAEQDREAAKKIVNREDAEKAIRKLELSQSIDASFKAGVIDSRERISLVNKLRQGKFDEIEQAVPVVKADPLRSPSVVERVRRRSALVSDLQDALREAQDAAAIEARELQLDERGILRDEQVKVARRDFLAGVAAAAAAANVPTGAKAAIATKTPISPALNKLLGNGNPVSVLEHIKSNSKDSGYRLIASKLLRGDWSKVSIVQREGSWTAAGVTTLNEDGSSTVEIMGDINSPEDGHNEQTILHELIHAYVQQRWGSLSAYLPHNKQLLKDTKDRSDAVITRFQDVWRSIGYAIQKTNPGLVDEQIWADQAFGSPSEMMSWVLTNPDAQAYLKHVTPEGERIATPKPRNQMTLWDKIVEFISELFGGGKSEKVLSALDTILSAGYAVLDAGANVETGDFNVKLARELSRSDNMLRDPQLKGPPKSAQDFATVAQDVTKKLTDSFDQQAFGKNLTVEGLKKLVGAMPLTHMVKHYAQQLPGLQKLFDAHAGRRATTAVFAHLYDAPKTLADKLAQSKEGRAALEIINELMELTAWDIDPTKPWESNDHLHERENVETLKRLHAKGYRSYNLLKGTGKHTLYDAYRQLNEVEHYASMALGVRQLVMSDQTLRNSLPRFEADPVEAFRNNSQFHSPDEARKYWRDELAASLTAAGDYIDSVRGTETEKETTRLSPLETYVSEVKKSVASMDKAPYFHLGRHGKYFVTAQVRLDNDKRADREALEHVARELEKIGVNHARVSGDLNRPTVYLKTDKIGQRDAVAELFLRLQNEGWLNKDVDVKSAPNDQGEWLPERTKTEMKKFITALESQFQPTPDMDEKETEDAKRLQGRMRTIAYDVWLNMLPDSATSKVLTHRESKPGFDKDMTRNFAFRYNIGVNSLASMAAEPYIDDAFKEMRGRLNEAKVAGSGLDVDTISTLYGEVAKREENLSQMAGDTSFDRWRALTHAYFLGFSPSYALVNMTQIPVLLWPELAKKHGFVGAAKAIAKVTPLAFRIMSETFQQGKASGGLLRAADTIITPSVIKAVAGDDAKLAEFLQNMVGSGIIDIGSSARELGTVAEGAAGEKTGKFLRYSASLGLYSETVSRLIAALAARDLHKGDNTIEYAKDVVRESMLEYSNYNQARVMGKMGLFGKFTPVMTQFMQYSTQLTFKLYREAYNAFGSDPAAQKEARAFLLSHLSAVTALAGTLGLPFATVAAFALEKLVDFLDDDDDPYDATAAYRNLLAGIMGPGLAEMVSRGIPRAGGYGFDISQRVGEQNLLPFSQWLTDTREMRDASAEAALRSLGAPVSMALSISQGLSKIAEGNILEGLALGTPTSIKGPSKAFQMTVDGYKDTKGNKLPMTPKATAYLAQLMGVNPAEKAEYSEEKGDQRARDTVLKKRATVLRNRMVNATIEQDRETMSSVWADIQQFNSANPGSTFMVTQQEIENSIRRRMKLQATSEAYKVPIGVDPRDLRGRELTRYANIEYAAQ